MVSSSINFNSNISDYTNCNLFNKHNSFKKLVFVSCFLLLIILFSSLSLALSIDVPENHYPNQQVYFSVCLSEFETFDNVSVFVSCLEDSLIESMPWSNNCKMFGFDSANLECDMPLITASKGYSFTSARTSVVDFKENLETTLSLNTSSKPLDLATRIYAYSLLNETEKIDELSSELLRKRDNENKCWPSGDCDLEYTVQTLYYLSQAGFGKDNRVYYDALLWVEYFQNKMKNEDWSLRVNSRSSISSDEQVSCNVFLDDAVLETFTLTRNDSSENIIFDYDSDKRLNVTCDKSFEVRLYNYFGDLYYNSWAREDKHVSFFMRGGCWSEDIPDWNVHEDEITLIKGRSVACVPGLTQRILLLNDLSKSSYDEGVAWLKGEIDRARIAGKQIGVNRGLLKNNVDVIANIDAFLVLRDDVEAASELKRQILFTQNNDGSFGFRKSSLITDEDFHVTIYAIDTFFEEEDAEWIDYANSWFFNHRLLLNEKNILINAISYDVFGVTHEVIKITPLMPYYNSNQTQFTLQSNEAYSIQTKVIQEFENMKFDVSHNSNTSSIKVSRISQQDGLVTSNLEIFNQDYFMKIPFASFKQPRLKFDFKKEYYFTEDEGILFVSVDKSDSEFICNLTFSDFFEDLTNERIIGDIMLPYYSEDIFDKEITVSSTCIGGKEVVFEEYLTHIRKYPNPPFSLKYKYNTISKPGHVIISNNLEESYDLSFLWTVRTDIYYVPTTLNISKDKLKLFIFQKTIHNKNETQNNVLEISALGYVEKIDFEILLTESAFVNEEYKYLKNYFKLILPFSFLLIIIGAIVLIFIKFKKIKFYFSEKFIKYNAKKKDEQKSKIISVGLNQEINQETDQNSKEILLKRKEQQLLKLKKVRQQNKKRSMLDVLVAIDKSLSESNEEITKELSDEGIKEKEIIQAISDVESMTNDNKEKTNISTEKKTEEKKN